MQSEEQIEKAIDKAVASLIDEHTMGHWHGDQVKEVARRAIAALSTDAEPVAWMDDGTTRNGSETTSYRVVSAETKAAMPKASSDNFNTPLYAAPPAPAVAVKASHGMAHILRNCVDTLKSNGFGAANIVEIAERALSAQVQDVAMPDGWQLVPKSATVDMETSALEDSKGLLPLSMDRHAGCRPRSTRRQAGRGRMNSKVGKLIRATVEPHTTLCLFETIAGLLESSDIKGTRARLAASKARNILRREQTLLLREFDAASLALKAEATAESALQSEER